MNLDYKFFILTLILLILYFVKFPFIEEFEEKIIQDGIKMNYNELRDQNFDKEEDNKYKKIYYNVPGKNLQFNKSVLKNYRYNKIYHTYAQELSFTDVHKIVSEIKSNKKFILETNFQDHFVKIFNQLFFKLNMNHIYHKNDTRIYNIIDYRLLIKQKIVKSIYKIVYEIKIYKKDKHYGFVFQNTLKYDSDSNIFNYLNIELVGFLNEEDIFFDNKKEKNYTCKYDTDKNKDECFDLTYQPDNLTRNNFLSGDFLTPFLDNFYDKKNQEKKFHEDYKKYNCFYNEGNTFSQCLSYNHNKQTYGVWDKPCNNNEECPFYKKNKNYENERGGCINGYCEMPTNVERRGYRFYKNRPYCYNCNKKGCVGESCFDCCEEQKDRKKYPNLKSPDYIFKNDNRE